MRGEPVKRRQTTQPDGNPMISYSVYPALPVRSRGALSFGLLTCSGKSNTSRLGNSSIAHTAYSCCLGMLSLCLLVRGLVFAVFILIVSASVIAQTVASR